MRFCLVFMILTGCAGVRLAEPRTEVFSESKYGTISSTQWLIQSTSTMPIPSCDWLKANNIEGIDAEGTYEITTDELCDEP